MAKAKLKTYDEALEAQVEGKKAVRDAKQALTAYLKTNKLKRNIDYTNDTKHGKKIARLNKAIERTSNALVKVNEAVKSLKPKVERKSKYDYPEGLTAEEKKKFRTKARAEANKASKGNASKGKASKGKTSKRKSKRSKK